MIQENKTFSMQDLAHTTAELVFAERHYRNMALFYRDALAKQVSAGINDTMLPLPPIAILYRSLQDEAIRSYVLAGKRLEQLQGIADSTMLPDLDY